MVNIDLALWFFLIHSYKHPGYSKPTFRVHPTSHPDTGRATVRVGWLRFTHLADSHTDLAAMRTYC